MNVALIFAGGIGARMGNAIPKQFLEWNGKAVIIHTIEVFERHPEIDRILVVCKEDWIDYTRDLIQQDEIRKVAAVIPGADTALNSQLCGLEEIKRLYPDDDTTVLIHDGVRPLIDEATISRCIASVRAYGSAITVTKAIETVIVTDENGGVRDILNRDCCKMAKAPQCFRLDEILDIHHRAIRENNHGFIDSASMMHAYGYPLHTVMGEAENIKITTPSDYYMYLGITKSRENNQ